MILRTLVSFICLATLAACGASQSSDHMFGWRPDQSGTGYSTSTNGVQSQSAMTGASQLAGFNDAGAPVAGFLGLAEAVNAVQTNDELTSAAGTGYVTTLELNSTAGPAVTLVTGTSVVINVSANCFKSSTGTTAYISIAVSGATTVAASDNWAVAGASSISSSYIPFAGTIWLTGLTPGSNTFTMAYRTDTSGSNWNFSNRRIDVRAL